MKQIIFALIRKRNLDRKGLDINALYEVGIKNIMDNIEFYYDKPYTCESVLKELFESGINEYLNKKENQI